MRALLVIAVMMTSVCTSPALAIDSELHIGRFSSGNTSGWKEQTIGLFKAKTTYVIAKDGDRTALVARSNKSASGQIYRLDLDPKEYPLLSWSWKIEHTIKKGDEKTKEGDDFAARVYVVFPRGFFSKTRAICYVWGNRLPRGGHVSSPFTNNVITVAVDSGNEQAGHWKSHQRNIYDDYRTFFSEEPTRLGAIAIMTDSDNTGESAVGYYGDVTLLRLRKSEETGNKHKKEPKAKEGRNGEQKSKEDSGKAQQSESGQQQHRKEQLPLEPLQMKENKKGEQPGAPSAQSAPLQPVQQKTLIPAVVVEPSKAP